jgi:hypothetical protein
MRSRLAVAMLGSALAACAGRDPQPLATVQAQDAYSDCTMIQAEIEATNAKATQLAYEQSWPVAEWLRFGMNFKDAGEKEATALQARQQYLTTLATEKCAPKAEPEPKDASKRPRQKPRSR